MKDNALIVAVVLIALLSLLLCFSISNTHEATEQWKAAVRREKAGVCLVVQENTGLPPAPEVAR